MSMRLRRWLPALGLAAGLCPALVSMAQPANDSCAVVSAGGFDIPGAGGTVSGTTALATVDGDCTCDNGTPGRDVYYRFTPSTTGVWRLSLCSGTTIDTAMSIHTGCPADTTTQIACDDDSCGTIGGPSRVTTTLDAGTTYIVRVGMWFATATGGTFSLNVAPFASITNDNCGPVEAAAPSIPGAGGVIVGTTEGATSDGFCSCDDGDGGAIDVYYKFVPNASSTWSFSLCAGSSLDSAMSLHSGCPADASNELICNDDGCGGIGVPSSFTISLTAGTTYLLRVGMWDSFDTTGDSFVLTVANFSQAGACCDGVTGGCTVSPSGASGCASGTTFQGTGTVCTPNPCPQPPPPANDECTGAIALTVNTPTAGTLSQATGAVITSCSGSDFDVWYTFTAPVAGSYGVTATLTTGDFVPAVAIFASAPCPVDPNSNDPADDGCQAQGGTGFVKRTGMALGETILIRVADFGEGTIFSIVVAPVQSGACCNNTSGACTSSNSGAAGCASGTTYQGDNTSCSPIPCVREACCNALTGGCTIAAAGACASGTTGQGTGSTCTVNPCPQPPPPANDECSAAVAVSLGVQITASNVFATSSGAGVIATNTGSCTAASLATGTHLDVWYSFVAPATTNYTIDSCGSALDTIISIHSACPADSSNILDCNDDSDAPAGNVACSNSNLSSRIQSVALTAGQTYYIGVAGYNGATGAFNLLVNYVDAASVGSCCVSITCTLTDAANCGGTFTAGGTCTPSPCGGPAGVCCRGATCTTTITSSVACTATLIGGQTAGASFPSAASCNTGPVSNAPCCYADYNKTSGVTVTDIFNFLSDWFAGSPYANVGGTGAAGPLSVQNIFDFLNNWFAGGC